MGSIKVSRRYATETIKATFSMFHYGLLMLREGDVDSKEKADFIDTALKFDEEVNTSEYEEVLSELDTESFKEYYHRVGKFASSYQIANWKQYQEEEPVTLLELNEELPKHNKTNEKLELIDGFTDEELIQDDFIFNSKFTLLNDILDDFNVGDKKENTINRILSVFNTNDKQSLIQKMNTDKSFLDRLMKKVNGTEKDEMLAILGEIFIESGITSNGSVTLIDNLPTQTIKATYDKGKVHIDVILVAYGTKKDCLDVKTQSYELAPLDCVKINYDNQQIVLPSLLLINSWQNALSTPEGLFYNYKDENIDFTKLSRKEKEEYFVSYVMHYLPSGFIQALGNPLQVIIMACISIVTAGLFAELGAALAAAGLAMSAIDGGKAIYGIVQANNEKEKAETIHALKKAAKLMAENIAKLTVDVVDVLMTVVGYTKGKKKKTIIENDTTSTELELCSELAEEYAFNAIHGKSNSDKVVLGKFEVLKDQLGNPIFDSNGNPIAAENSYNLIAKKMDAQYFELDNWDELATMYNPEQIWKINEKFLDIQIASGRDIYLSTNPDIWLNGDSFYSKELQYLISHGFKFKKMGEVWYVSRK